MDQDPQQQFGRLASFLASPKVRFAVLIVLIAALAAAVFVVGAPSRTGVERFVRSAGLAAPAVYVLVYAVLTLLMFPGAVITAAGGVLFGTWVGTGLTVVGATIGAMLAFIAAQWLGRDQVERIAGDRLARLDEWLERRGFTAILYLRLIPVVPFNVLNYAAGVTAISRRDYLLGTFVGIIPATFAYTALGSNIDDPTSPAFLGALALVVVLAVGGPFVNRWLRRRGRDVLDGQPDERTHRRPKTTA